MNNTITSPAGGSVGLYPPATRQPRLDFSLKQNALFLQVATSRTLSSVAQSLHMSAASVTRQLTALEAALGVTLLDRAHGANQLTEAGQVFLPHAQGIFKCQLALAQAAQQAAPASAHQASTPAHADEAALKRRALHLVLPQIQAFTDVVQAKRFVKAAQLGAQTQSGLSRLVKDLESALGVGLLERLAAGIALTTAGTQLLPLAQQLLALHTQASAYMHMWRPQTKGKLLIVGSRAVMPPLIPVLLQRLKADFPHHQVEIRNELSDQVEQAVLSGSAIVGLCVVVHKKPHFTYTPLLRAQLGLIWSPQMHMPIPMQIAADLHSLDALAHIPIVRFTDNALISEALTASQTHFPAYFDSPVRVDSVDAGLDLVASGAFAMLITGVGASRKAAQGLQFMPLPHLLPSVEVSVISRRDAIFDERREYVRQALVHCARVARWHESVAVD